MSVDIREQFSFAQPDQIVNMIQILCTDAYGSMLWDLQSNPAEQYFKCWNTAIKLVYGVPRSTYTYLVEGFLAKDQPCSGIKFSVDILASTGSCSHDQVRK